MKIRRLISFTSYWVLIILLSGCDLLSELMYSPIQKEVQHRYPSIAFDGTNFLVVWGSGDIMGRRISNEGSFLTPSFKLMEDDTTETQPAVAFFDTMFLVVWVDHRINRGGIFERTISRTGVPESGPGVPLITSGRSVTPHLAKGYDGSLLYWVTHRRYVYDGNIAILDLSGNLVTSRSIGSGYQYTNRPIASASDRYLVLRGKSVLFFDTQGGQIESTELPVSEWASAAFGDDLWLVTSETKSSITNTDIIAFMLRHDGEIIDTSGVRITDFPKHDRFPVAEFGDETFLILWRRDDSLCARRVSSGGTLIDSTDRIIAEGRGDIRRIKIQYGNGVFMTVWEEWTEETGYRVYGCRISQDGNLLSPGIFEVSPED